MSSNRFKCIKTNSRYAVSNLKKKISYNPCDFGFGNLKGDGSGIRLCIIDTGYPVHKEISVPMSNVVNFTNGDNSLKDEHGHGTGISGIIKANGKNLVGLAPRTECFYAKGLHSDGRGDHGAVQASILYAIVKQVDIIVMAFGSEVDHPVLHDVIKKAHKERISLIAASGNSFNNTKDADFPARFPEVMSVGRSNSNLPILGDTSAPSIYLPIKSLDTCYKNDKFIKMSGTSVLTAVVAGIAAVTLQRVKPKKARLSPTELYSSMIRQLKKGID